MIQIEKLKSSNPAPQISLVDLIHKDNTLGQNILGIYPATHLLKSFIEAGLENITIGSKHGTDGIDINLLLAEKQDFIIETTLNDLMFLPHTKQIRLLKEYTVILTDLEEGGAIYGFMGGCLIDYIKKLKIIPKQIISVTSGFNQQSYLELNIHSVYLPVWPIFTVLSEKFYSDLVFNNILKQEKLDLLDQSKLKFGLFPNKKPRFHRVKTLAELHYRELLQQFDWSLVYSSVPLGTKDDIGNFIKSPNNFQFNNTLEEYIDDKIKSFLSHYSFPRVLEDSKHKVFGDSIGPAESWFGKYEYYISAETYHVPHKTSLGTLGFITEKTFKAMCIGAYPFVIGLPNVEKKTMELGFKLKDYGYDESIGHERILAVCDAIESMVKQPSNTHELVLHNFDLITNPTFLAGLVTKPLNEFFNLRKLRC